ncbi:MAG: alpha-N-arabinofuranosidase [Clostridiales bacterium]|nr:alpha-N-arabinofuranosidase [Clostridiales bacterium]
MEKTRIFIHREFKRGKIDPRIYGSFVEHMGRVVYSGIYEPGHSTANDDGFRQDVIEKTQQMGVTAVRYPGGNFVSNYDWMDGIGTREKRPRRLDLAWKSIETNEVGIDEFMKWAGKAGIEPILAVNLGTKGIESALSFLEYCNLPVGSYFSDMRCANGNREPYAIKTWCLGNEMDGEWQIGHKTAEEYGRLAHETGKAMKIIDPSIELVVCGSSMSSNPTFGEWERIVLEEAYECADYLSLHQYYGGQEKGTGPFLAQSLDMERYIQTVCGICDTVMLRKHHKKKLGICFDEWGVWSVSDKEVQAKVEQNPWRVAPAISEQIYSMEDALLFASMLMNLIRYSDRVKIACQSLLTNVSACIMTETSGAVWLQTIYYPFALMAKYGQGIVLETRSVGPSYQTDDFSKVPFVDHLAVINQEKKELVLFFVNRSENEAEVEIDIQLLTLGQILESQVLCSKDRKSTNQFDHSCVIPQKLQNFQCDGKCVKGKLLPFSFQLLRISC